VNFLAHLWLADRTDTSLAGAVLGDLARGADLSAYPDALAHGIRVHRRVDAATDRHAGIAGLRNGFADGHRRYAGIVLDLAADHALALDWDRYHDRPLESFCADAAQQLAAESAWFVHAGGRPIEAASFTRLLLSYAEVDGIDRALHRTATRLREPNRLLRAGERWTEQIGALRALLPRLLEDLRATALAA
jgi:acyl carrier protein phosphodiesterase